MKHAILLLLFTLLSQIGIAQQDTIRNLNRGKFAVGELIDGKKHGEWRQFFESGELERLEHYEHGALTGTWEAYYIDGTVAMRARFEDKKMVSYSVVRNNHDVPNASYETQASIVAQDHFTQEEFWDLVKGQENIATITLDALTEEQRIEEVLITEKFYNGQVPEEEYVKYMNTKSELFITGRLDSMSAAQVLKACQMSMKRCEFGFHDDEGRPAQVLYISAGGTDSTLYRKYFNAEPDQVFSSVTTINGRISNNIEYLNGESLYRLFVWDDSHVIAEGLVKNGLRNGEWLFHSAAGVTTKRKYKKGVLVK